MAERKRITIAALALGGQGGGVLADWILAVGEANGFRAQGTSIAGVAQRTGSTVYYIELFPDDGGPEPILSLNPVPGDIDTGYDAAGNPMDLSPQARRAPRPVQPEVSDDGYIYPADGSSNDQRYPSPRPYRRVYQGQTYGDQYGQQYAVPRGYDDPQNYYAGQQGYYAPRPYLRPRGLFSDAD